MIIVSWNIRELNKFYKQREFKKFLLLNKVDLIACLETRVKQQSAKEIQRKVGVDWKFTDNYAYAPNGRIWIGWKVANVKVTVLDCSNQMIHCCVTDNNSSFSSYITFVYGLHTIHDRASLWRSLRNMQTNGPWLIIGDFNSVLHEEDRLNGIPVHQADTTDFQRCIDDIGVGQITKRGCKFSWSCSDHSPIMIITKVNRVKVKKTFRLMSTVMKLQEYKEVVQNTWGQQIQGYTIGKKDTGLIKKWEAVQEQILKQKSRATWIKLGGCNSKYSHAYMRARQARNKVICIYNDQHIKISEPKQIQLEFTQFFQHLLGTAATELPGIDISIIWNGPCLTMNQQQ
ncbi:uncharacterized protein LOC142170507 [Nicotiana tabacum]|uniref:Uncharacterized protein LOC142170507 n=1 Tax=Nicotiana tabacum TaxID=4097 RepID=A0AC58SU95_TOBAC